MRAGRTLMGNTSDMVWTETPWWLSSSWISTVSARTHTERHNDKERGINASQPTLEHLGHLFTLPRLRFCLKNIMRPKINNDSWATWSTEMLSQLVSEHKAQQIWTNGKNLQNLSLCVFFLNTLSLDQCTFFELRFGLTAAQIPLDLIQIVWIKEDSYESKKWHLVTSFGGIECIFSTFVCMIFLFLIGIFGNVVYPLHYISFILWTFWHYIINDETLKIIFDNQQVFIER